MTKMFLQVKLDDGAWEPCKLTGEKHPLFTALWNPELYVRGRHTLEVRVKDSSGSQGSTRIDFALDNSLPHFPLMARVALMMDITTVVSIQFCQLISVSDIIYKNLFFLNLVSNYFCGHNNLGYSAILHYSLLAKQNHP